MSEGTYRKYEREDGNTVYVRLNKADAGNFVFVDHHNPYSQGYGGSIFQFELEDGTVDEVKGPWHSSPEVLPEPHRVSELYLTKIVLRWHSKDGVLIYDEGQWVLGHFYRGYRAALQLAKLNNVPVYFYSESKGGSMAGVIDPDKETQHPRSQRKEDLG